MAVLLANPLKVSCTGGEGELLNAKTAQVDEDGWVRQNTTVVGSCFIG